MDKRASGTANRTAEFDAPDTATPLTTLGAWLLYAIVAVLGVASAVSVVNPAVWPAIEPTFTVLVFALFIAFANAFGTFQTVDGLAEYTSLALPMGFAALIVLDWRDFVACLIAGEVFTFASETLRRTNPTKWYIRIFNVLEQVVCGAAATLVLHGFHATLQLAPSDAFDPRFALVLMGAGLVWRLLDGIQVKAMITLASRQGLRTLRIAPRAFAAQFALFLIAVPFARLWYENVWMAFFALAPLAVAYRLLHLPEMEHRLRTDEQTGLINAVTFGRVLETTIESATERGHVALLAIDIDHFKSVNDTFGHLAGDVVIERFAQILGATLRAEDVAARTGGEEFAILLKDNEPGGALAFAAQLRARVENEPFLVDGDVTIRITASIGVALFPSDARTPRDLRKAADDALYAAKRGGRNTVREVSTAGA